MPDPRWRQIAEDLRQKIETGEIGHDGAPLPTELELQDLYGASRNTVRDAIRWLAARDLVYSRSGQGTFVKRKPEPFVTSLAVGAGLTSEGRKYAEAVDASKRTRKDSPPIVEVQQAAGLVADELQVPAGSTVVSRHQRRHIDDDPYSLQTTWYPMDLARKAERLLQAIDIEDGAVLYLDQELGIKEAGRRDRITVRLPDAVEVSFFGLPDDGRISVYELVRTGFDAEGHPIRVTITTLPVDRNQFVIVDGAVPGDLPQGGSPTGKNASPGLTP